MRLFGLISLFVMLFWSGWASANNMLPGGAWHGVTASHDDGAGGSHHAYYSKDPLDACVKTADYGVGAPGTEYITFKYTWANGPHYICHYHHVLQAGGWYEDNIFWECPSGQIKILNYCLGTPDHDKPRGPSCPDTGAGNPDPSVGDPIALSTGAMFQEVVDYTTGGANALEFRRYYQSYLSSQPGTMGQGWTHSYDRYLIANNASTPTAFFALRPNGERFDFVKSGSNWISASGASDQTARLVEVTMGSIYEVVDGSDRTDRFENVSGAYRLVQSRWRNGYQQDVAYGTDGQLATVTDSYDRTLTIAWNQSKPISVTAPGGYAINFGYTNPVGMGRLGQLSEVQKQSSDGAGPEVTRYLYEMAGYPYLVTGVVDGNGNRYSTFEYDEFGRGLVTEETGGASRYEIAYDDVNKTRTVTNPLGKEAVYHFTKRQGVLKLDTIDGLASANCPAATSALTYDTNGFIGSRVDWNGNVTTYVRETRGLETSRTEAVGEPEERTITTAWHSTFRVPTQIVMPGLTIDFTYDSQGRLTQRTETDTTGHSVPYSTNGQTRTTTYTWNTDGELTSVDGPRTDVSDVTTYSYDGSGNLVSIENALSHETEVTASNARNQPLSIADPNGIVTDLAYDVHGRLIKRTVHLAGRDEVMEMAYDAAGQVISVTSANGSRVEYEHDDAHRLTTIKNSLGERIEFTLNAMGNRTQTKITSTTGAILQTQTRVYDELGRLLQSVGASSQTTSFEYNDNGNTIEVADPRSAITSNAFDALDRLVQSTDALNGVTELAYDNQGNLISVEDAKNQVTSSVYNGFGDVIQLTSPDTGVSVYEVDKAGNRTKETDSRGVVSNYSYDALNRVTAVTYPATVSENVAFSYDSVAGGNKGVGYLTGMTDEHGSASYVYDGQGRLTQETRVISTVGYTTSYGYDVAGNLQKIAYPTGRVVTYQRDALGRVTAVLAQTNSSAPPALIAGNISYLPFGPIQSLTFGNGVVATYEYDQDYRLTGITSSKGSSGVQDLALTHDGTDNIIAITDALDATRNQTFEYDLLGRLTDAAGLYGTEEYTYDAVGNRLTRTLVQSSVTTNVTYAYASGSNQLDSASNSSTTRSFTYDDAGNTVSDAVGGGASFTYAFNDANRLKQSQESGGPTFNYGYDGFGERVLKQPVGQTGAHFRYDPEGHLIHESDDLGNPVRSYIYLGDLPIAQIEPGAPGTPTDVVVDNTDSGASATGNWSTATAGQGHEGANYQRQPNGAPAGAVVVDNSSPQFSAIGVWATATSPSGFEGADYRTRNEASGVIPDEIVIDNSDAGFSTIGVWNSTTSVSGYFGTDYLWHAANQLSPEAIVIDNVDAGFQVFGTWGTSTNGGSEKYGADFRYAAPNQPASSSIIVDNDATGTTAVGTWTLSTAGGSSEKYGPNFRWNGAGTGADTYTWAPTIPSQQFYNVYAMWRQYTDRATNAPYTIYHAGGSTTVQVNQKANGGKWNLLGTFELAPGQSHRVVITDDANGTVIADAIMITSVSDLNRAEWTPTLPAAEDYKVFAWWRQYSDRATNSPYKITHDGGTTTVTVNQQANGAKWNLLGTFALTPGQGHKVTLTDEANGNLVADAVQITPVDAPQPSATWTPTIVARAKYEVFARWQEANGRATNAPFTVYHEGGSTTVLMNQEQNGNTWMSLGTYVLAPGQNHRVVLGDNANGFVTADVMKFVPVAEATVAWPIASIPANGDYKVYAKWPASPLNASDASYTVTDATGAHPVTVNQKVNGGQWNLLGTFSFNATTPGYKVELSSEGNGQVAADAIYYANDNAVADSFTWSPTLPSAGDYAVYARWPDGAADSGTAVYTITHDGGVASQSVSQKANGGEWVWLGTYAMDPVNDPEVTLSAANDGAVYADAVRFVSGDAIGGDIVYSHSDQITTIQKLTDASGALVWDRIARPFGETVSISAASGVEQKLRFPGQYADETGLSYNYFRDYDPTLGRYIQSDPVGLHGGINTYAYVGGNPSTYSDPAGLVCAPCLIPVVIEIGGEIIAIVRVCLLAAQVLEEADKVACDKQFDHDEKQCYKNHSYNADALRGCLERAATIYSQCLKGEGEVRPWRDVDTDGVEFPKPPRRPK